MQFYSFLDNGQHFHSYNSLASLRFQVVSCATYKSLVQSAIGHPALAYVKHFTFYCPNVFWREGYIDLGCLMNSNLKCLLEGRIYRPWLSYE